MSEHNEVTALRDEVEYLRAEVARLRSQQAAHVCAVPPQPVWQKTFPAAGCAGGALPLTIGPEFYNTCAAPATVYGDVPLNTGCAAPVATYMVNIGG